jgi:hypothetical protein
MNRNEMARQLLKLASTHPESFRFGHRFATLVANGMSKESAQLALSPTSSQLSIDDDARISRWELEGAVDRVCAKDGLRPITTGEMTSRAMDNIHRVFPGDVYHKEYAKAKKIVTRYLIDRYAWVPIGAGADANAPDHWNQHPLPTDKLEAVVNALEAKRPGRKPYRVESNPHGEPKRPHQEQAQIALSAESAESVPSEIKNFDLPTEARIVDIVEPFLRRRPKASDKAVLDLLAKQSPYLFVKCGMAPAEFERCVLHLLVRRFGRQWSENERWRTEAAEYPERFSRPANRPASVAKPAMSLKEQAHELREAKGAGFGQDDGPKLTPAEQESLINRMLRRVGE